MTAKIGIGEGGRALKQVLEDSERLWQETGFYYGLEELEQSTGDPLKLELFHSRLLAALMAGRETTMMIAASALVRELGELCCGLYTAEGHSICQSTGITAHIPVMGRVVDWMIRQGYEDEVGIEEGDLFCSNEMLIAGFHPPDIYDLTPIFWEGELVAWAITCIMEPEIGALSPGCMPVAATERFVDGLRFCAEKIGTKDKLSMTFENRVKFNTRLSDLI
ncbi:hydantoinase B/oxoprolinase family protein, partial [Chloroflexota bacterium]